MSPKKTQENDISTEERIKNAARTVFHQKGYAATRTRDIAEEAGINLALLNYYFRSKEKLFDIIMMEGLGSFVQSMTSVFNDQQTTLYEKVAAIVEGYMDLFWKEPELPVFVLSEMRRNPEVLMERMQHKQYILDSYFLKQYFEAVEKGEVEPISVFHFIMNITSLTIFPFISGPMLKAIAGLTNEQHQALMQERKKLIPQWIKLMFNKQA
ncbi:MAG: TetR/AcrR family transcriptional regulator [Chitinophagales bacterium]|nr:TetR/AcrR family transcriptional regulator [Chitinophagales bacterium]